VFVLFDATSPPHEITKNAAAKTDAINDFFTGLIISVKKESTVTPLHARPWDTIQTADL
jgi:hypothetical protein